MPTAMQRPTTIVAIWTRKSRQPRTGAWIGCTSSMNETPESLMRHWVVALRVLGRLPSQLDARVPSALGQKRFWIGHFQNLANCLALIGSMLVVGFHDAISHPVTEITRLVRRTVIKPIRKIGLSFI